MHFFNNVFKFSTTFFVIGEGSNLLISDKGYKGVIISTKKLTKIEIKGSLLTAESGAKLKNVTCDTYSEMAKDMKSYKYDYMWSENTANVESGTNDVDDYITGYVRTDKASISFNGAWAQNIDIGEMYVDFLGDKGGARLDYGGRFTFWSGETLEPIKPEYEIPNMYLCEDKAFIESIESGIKDKNNIEFVLESAKLLDALYSSANVKKEIEF